MISSFLSTRFALLTLLVSACGGSLSQTQSNECPQGRTLLDGVCVSESVADYVSCVRAQGAQLDSASSQKLSAEAGYLGVKASGAADLSESLQKKYSASDQAMMAIVGACNSRAGLQSTTPAAKAPEIATGSASEPPVAPPPTGAVIAMGFAGRATDGTWERKGDALFGGPDNSHYQLDVGAMGDLSLEVTAEDLEGSGPEFGVLLRMPENREGAYYFGISFRFQAYQLFTCAGPNGCRVITSDWTKPNNEYKPSRLLGAVKNRLRVDFKGPNYVVYVNGERLDAGRDNSFEHGKVALVASGGRVKFSELKISKPN